MTKLLDSRTETGSPVTLWALCPRMGPSSCRMLDFDRFPLGSPLLLLLQLLSCSFAPWLGSLLCLYLFSFSLLFEGCRHRWSVLSQAPCLLKVLAFHVAHSLDIKTGKGYRWQFEPFQHANYVKVKMILYQRNRVLNYSFLSLPVQYVKLQKWNNLIYGHDSDLEEWIWKYWMPRVGPIL